MSPVPGESVGRLSELFNRRNGGAAADFRAGGRQSADDGPDLVGSHPVIHSGQTLPTKGEPKPISFMISTSAPRSYASSPSVKPSTAKSQCPPPAI